MSVSYTEMQGRRDDDYHPDHWDGYGSLAASRLYELVLTEETDSDLYIPAPQERLSALAVDLERIEQALAEGMPVARLVDWRELEERAAVAHDVFHQAFTEMAESDKKYAKAIQDWVIEELTTRHPDFAQYPRETPEELLVDLLEMIEVVDALMAELETEDEDSRLIDLATTWRYELMADVSGAEVRRLYALAA